MRFSTITSTLTLLFSSTALAAPASGLRSDEVTLSNFYVRNIDNAIESVEFDLAGNITCSATKPTEVIVCGDSAYRFYIVENDLSNYNVTIYEQTGPAAGLYQQQAIETYCRAGGSSASDFVCTSPYDTTYTLTFDGQSQ